MSTGARSSSSPFRNLDYFTRDDVDTFAGREDEIEEVATRITAGETLVVYGPSGVGKTSLLCAGVVPTLETRRRYRTTYVRPLRSPLGDVLQAVGALAEDEESLEKAIARISGLQHAAEGVSSHAPFVLVVDQVEELFTRFDESQRRPLWDALVEALDDPRVPLRLVLSLREDYLHLLDDAHPRLSNLLDRRFRLRGLLPFSARTAILRPLVRSGVRYAPELIDRCIADLTEVPAGRPDDGVVDPLLLQIVCSDVYRRALLRSPNAASLTLADYAETGGPAGIFHRHLGELFKRAATRDRLLLSLVLYEMTTAQGTKRPTTASRLQDSGLRATDDEIRNVLDQLVKANLARSYDAEVEPWFELVHDRLVKALPEWFVLEPQFLRVRFMREVVRQLSKGISEGMANTTLLSKQQLQELVEPFRSYIRFNQQERLLLFRSAIAAENEVDSWREDFESVVPNGAPAVLLSMLGQVDARRAAAASVEALRVIDPEVSAKCLQLALYDEDATVQESAASALKLVAGEAELAELARVLKNETSRPAALRVLGVAGQVEAFRSKIDHHDLKVAARLHERGVLATAAENIRLRGGDGLWEGARMAGILSLVATLFWVILTFWISQESIALFITSGSIVTGLVTVTLGMAWGRVAARALAKRHALEQSSSWLATLGESRALLVHVITFLALSTAAAFILRGTELLRAPVACAVAGAALTIAGNGIVALSLILLELGIAGIPWHPLRTRLWITAGSTSVPWLAAMALGRFLLPRPAEDGVYVLLIPYFFGALCSAAIATIGGALVESSRHQKPPKLPVSPRSPRLHKLLVLAPFTMTLAVATGVAYRNPLPFWAPIIDVSQPPAGAPPSNSSTSLLGGRWLRFHNGSESPRLILLRQSSPGNDPAINSDLTSFTVWPGNHEHWFETPPTTIDFRQPYSLAELDPDHANPKAGTYALVPLDRSEKSTRRWRRELTMSAAAASLTAITVGCREPSGKAAWQCGDISGMESTVCGLDFSRSVTDVNNGKIEIECSRFPYQSPPPDAEHDNGATAQAVVLFLEHDTVHAPDFRYLERRVPRPDPAFTPRPAPTLTP